MASSSNAEGAGRSTSFGQHRPSTAVDRFGVWLSSIAVRRGARFAKQRVADFGCGYDANFVRSQLDVVRSALLVDVAIAEDLKQHPKVTALEGDLAELLPSVPSRSVDVTLCLSVLEHLWDPETALRNLRRVTAPGGVVLVNVPTWQGKRALELSAFRFGLSPADEIDDHKWYFDPRELWLLLVRAGFRPSEIKCHRHKLGLNTFAVCRVGAANASDRKGAGSSD
jgi:SAM-dependent methyltransferase